MLAARGVREAVFSRQEGTSAILCSAHRRRSGFTLIELLVVVATMALLMAILLPSLRRARAQTRRVVCQSNVRQVAIGWHGYLRESGGYFFQKGLWYWSELRKRQMQVDNAHLVYGGPPGAELTYQEPNPKPLNRHVKELSIFACPADTGSEGTPSSCCEYVGTSYLTNATLTGGPLAAPKSSDCCYNAVMRVKARLKNQHLSRIQGVDPSRLILVGDYGWITAMDKYSANEARWHVRPSAYNLAFLDGHADFTQIQKGRYVTSSYTVVPFRDLLAAFAACQDGTACE